MVENRSLRNQAAAVIMWSNGGARMVLRARQRGSSRFQAHQLCLKFEAQLSAFLLGEPVGHLRENGAVEQGALGIPGHRLRRPHLGENPVEFLPNRIRIGPEYGRRRIRRRHLTNRQAISPSRTEKPGSADVASASWGPHVTTDDHASPLGPVCTQVVRSLASITQNSLTRWRA